MISPGRCYLIEHGVPMAYQTFRDALAKSESEGLCITSELPETIRNEYGIEDVELIWLSRTDGENAITPADLETLRDTLSDFVEEREGRVVLLDGVEYLITINGFDRTLDFLHDIWERVALTNAILIVPISPPALKERHLALIERYSEVMEVVE